MGLSPGGLVRCHELWKNFTLLIYPAEGMVGRNAIAYMRRNFPVEDDSWGTCYDERGEARWERLRLGRGVSILRACAEDDGAVSYLCGGTRRSINAEETLDHGPIGARTRFQIDRGDWEGHGRGA